MISRPSATENCQNAPSETAAAASSTLASRRAPPPESDRKDAVSPIAISGRTAIESASSRSMADERTARSTVPQRGQRMR